MAKCSMMVYEPADKVPDGEYWKRYISFYEKFWDRPAGPKSVWWGAEYDEFRRALAASLGIKTEEVRDCFFTKGDGGHLICRIDDPATLGIVSCENFIPFEWLAAFDGEKRDFFYTHTGFGAVHHDSIYYVENIATAMERIEAARSALKNLGESVSKYPELARIKDLPERLSEMNAWLRGFDAGGEIVLNYGEICSHITQDSMKNENSVSDLKRIIAGIGSGDFEQAESGLKYLNAKWAEIADAINRSGKQNPDEKSETEN